ncbi:hypothetical protein TrVFT333_010201 [Trichoderma virens FT-333]|nr:hypothetical protein TrVFT333_010201 [Trichoderma virens FT-333]
MAAQQPELDRTFVNLTDDPAEGRGARRTYIRRAVMKNFHKRRNQKKRASRHEGEATSSCIPENGPLEPVTLIDWQSGPPSRALIPTFTPWELLSAAQCLAIYVLLRIKLGKNNRSFPNGDIALLYTLGALFRRLQFERLLDITHHPSDDWRQWVFCESFIRIATIYFTLNVIVSMEFGLPCNSPQDWNIDDMPLPASKASWGAQNTTDWTKFTKVLPPYKQLKWRALLSPAASNDCPVEEWKESSDELGMVVTMAMTVRAQQLRDPSQSSSSSGMI